jgi:hypothetical protein
MASESEHLMNFPTLSFPKFVQGCDKFNICKLCDESTLPGTNIIATTNVLDAALYYFNEVIEYIVAPKTQCNDDDEWDCTYCTEIKLDTISELSTMYLKKLIKDYNDDVKIYNAKVRDRIFEYYDDYGIRGEDLYYQVERFISTLVKPDITIPFSFDVEHIPYKVLNRLFDICDIDTYKDDVEPKYASPQLLERFHTLKFIEDTSRVRSELILLLLYDIGIFSDKCSLVTKEYTSIVYKLLTSSKIKYAVCDSSVAFGTNFPLNSIIVTDEFLEYEGSDITLLSQLMGRVGRRGISSHGIVYGTEKLARILTDYLSSVKQKNDDYLILKSAVECLYHKPR